MEIIYIDDIFILNFATDYLLCLASAHVSGLRLKRGRYAAAAFIGAVYAAAAYLPGLEFLTSPLMKFSAALLMSLAAYGGEEHMFRCCAVFIAVSSAFGGFIWAISLAGGRPALDMRSLLLAFALCYGLLQLIFRARAGLADKKRLKAKISLGDRSCEFMLLSDSGNCLRDPITGRDVMVVCPHALEPIFREDSKILELDAVEFLSAASGLERFKGKLRLIPYSAVGSEGLLPAFVPDRAEFDGKCREVVAAVSKNASGDGYEGII
ncbi:MAG: sigma-E processing peptidase SpoIIGA [Candidatus Limivicinus sp.]